MELRLDDTLQRGIESHKEGQVEDAERIYSAILKAQPKHPDANYNMGALAVSVGKIQEALLFFKIALEANPSIGQYWLSYIRSGLIERWDVLAEFYTYPNIIEPLNIS
jgi:tetratricopeptide (TPR) repeat protein|tara:strand:+ start:1086 stop:1409 length:324 start_codon:yes stop_codon:yes gene_type:complete